jgi:flagellar basal body-associated protein FliL
MADEPTPEPTPPAKPRRKWLGAVVTLILIAVAAAGGTLLGPRLLGARGAAPALSGSAMGSAEPEGDDEADDADMVPMSFAPIIIDVRDKDGATHHMKIGLSAETPKDVSKEEFEKYSPRGREAAIVFLRSWKFDDLTDPAQFEKIVGLLQARIVKAMGEKHVKRVVITDYVAQ